MTEPLRWLVALALIGATLAYSYSFINWAERPKAAQWDRGPIR